MKYINVVIDNNSDHTDNLYTYCCEDDRVKVGSKVYVPFARGNRIRDAYVFQIVDSPPEEIKGIKKIVSVDSEISLSEEVISTCAWMKNRYLCRYIDAIKCFTPSGTSSKRGKVRTPYKDASGGSDTKYENLLFNALSICCLTDSLRLDWFSFMGETEDIFIYINTHIR
jgi:primosomal protein N' (replication factor Y)